MNRRFQIEDLIIQDASGVVFRALDRDTGQPVALRRFFPFGASGGGLMEDEQTAYDIALGRLAGLRHPALRSVVCGGCDPVDGMPFIATEWIEGTMLESILRQGPLPVDVALELLKQALEVCELLSHVLSEEAVWVETDPRTIVVGSKESGRGFTFWISPLKWLGGDEQARGLESIIELTEEIMGWKGQIIGEQAGRGLGAWIKWIRGAKTTTLREVRENLAAATGGEPPPAAQSLVAAAAATAVTPIRRRSSKIPLLAGVGVLLIGTGVVGWVLTRNRMKHAANISEVPASVVSAAERVSEQAGLLAARAAAADQSRDALLASQRSAVEQRSGIFTPAEAELLASLKGRDATLEGKLEMHGFSESGKTLYLYFSGDPPIGEPRGAVLLKDVTTPDGKLRLTSLSGKTIRITGTVKMRGQRPEIEIQNLEAIQVVE